MTVFNWSKMKTLNIYNCFDIPQFKIVIFAFMKPTYVRIYSINDTNQTQCIFEKELIFQNKEQMFSMAEDEVENFFWKTHNKIDSLFFQHTIKKEKEYANSSRVQTNPN